MTVSDHVIERFREELLKWGEENHRDFAWRNTSDPYEILIAEILLQRTSASAVEPVYQEFIREYSTLDQVAASSENDLSKMLQPLGLHNRRARSIRAIGSQISDGEIPKSEDELMELPHVGKYVANAILCFGYGESRPIVDSNVIRIYQRVFDVPFSRQRDEELWEFASKVIPDNSASEFNLALLDFAAQVCKPRNPACQKCPMAEFCHYFNN